MTATKPRLKIIANRPVSVERQAEPFDLMQARAARLFPDSPHLQAEWLRAKRILHAVRPRVEIGGAHCDTTRFARSMREAGVYGIAETIELPAFLERAMGLGGRS